MRAPAALAACALLAACASSPRPVQADAQRDAPSLDLAVGALAAALVDPQIGPYGDPALAAYVAAVGRRVSPPQGEAMRFEAVVTDDPRPSATALPGGRVRLSRGLLLALGSEAELAAVLAHEMAHAELRHGVQSFYARLLDIEQDPAVSDDHQHQADRRAIELLRAAGYAPRALPRMLRAVEAASRLSGEQTDQRALIARLGRAMLLIGAQTAGDVDAEAYAQKLEGIVVGEDPRGGVVLSGRFVCERDGFSLSLPAGATASFERGELAVGPAPQISARAYPRPSLLSNAVEAAVNERPHRALETAGHRVVRGSLSANDAIDEVALVEAPAWLWVLRAPANGATVLDEIVASLRPAPPGEAGRPHRLALVRVTRRSSLESALALCKRPQQRAFSALLNGREPSDPVEPGELVRCVESR